MADKPKNKTESKADKSKEMSDNNLAITKLKEKNRMLDSDWTRVGGPVNSSQDVKDEQYAKDKLINDLDLKGFEMIGMCGMTQQQFSRDLELWLKARASAPESILELARALLDEQCKGV